MTRDPIFVAVQGRGLISIPAAIRRHFGLDRPGAQVEVIEREGEIVLRPHVAVPVDQAWFWTPEWQEGEREADEQAAAGQGRYFATAEEMFAALDSEPQ